MAHNRNVYRFFAVPTVLIVEDNPALAHAVAEVLRSIGYGTLIAHDGEAALSEAERSRPEVALVDLELPAIDGLEVALDCARATASRSGLSPTRLGRTTPRRIPRRQTLASTMCSSSRPQAIRLSRPFSTAESNLPCNGSSPSRPCGAV